MVDAFQRLDALPDDIRQVLDERHSDLHGDLLGGKDVGRLVQGSLSRRIHLVAFGGGGGVEFFGVRFTLSFDALLFSFCVREGLNSLGPVLGRLLFRLGSHLDGDGFALGGLPSLYELDGLGALGLFGFADRHDCFLRPNGFRPCLVGLRLGHGLGGGFLRNGNGAVLLRELHGFTPIDFGGLNGFLPQYVLFLQQALFFDPLLFDGPLRYDAGHVHLLLGCDFCLFGVALLFRLVARDVRHLRRAPDFNLPLLFEPRVLGFSRYIELLPLSFEVLVGYGHFGVLKECS